MSDTSTVKSNRRPPHMDEVVDFVRNAGGSVEMSNKDIAGKLHLGERTFRRALSCAAGFGLVVIDYGQERGPGCVGRTIRLPESNEMSAEVSR